MEDPLGKLAPYAVAIDYHLGYNTKINLFGAKLNRLGRLIHQC